MGSLIIRNTILKIILCCCLVLLIAAHLLKGFNSSFEFNQFNILIFLLFFISIFTEKKELYFSAFCLQGIFTILTLKTLSNLTPGAIFFVALLYSKRKNELYVILVLLIISYLGVSYLNESSTISQIMEGVFVNIGFILFLYIAVIKQPENIEKLSKITPLTKRQLLILKYLAMDIPRKQIPDKVKDSTLWRLGLERDKFTLDIINTEIAKIKKILDIVNGEALGVWYNKHVDILNKKVI